MLSGQDLLWGRRGLGIHVYTEMTCLSESYLCKPESKTLG